MKRYLVKHVFTLQDQIQLVLKKQRVSIKKSVSKSVYGELKSKLTTLPTAQSRYNELVKDAHLEWKEIHSLPFRVALDTKSREFQCRVLNSHLATNIFLKKIGKISSSACSFCGAIDESLEHLLVTCNFTTILWERLKMWCNNRDIRVQSLSAVDIIFGDWKKKNDFLLFNHIIIIAKQYIYYCRNNNSKPLFNFLWACVTSVVQLEYKVAKGNNK